MDDLRIGGRCERHLSPKPCAKCAAEHAATARELTPDDVRAMLRRMVDEAGSQKSLAQKLNVSEQYLSDVLLGRREIGPAIADALNLEIVVAFRPRGVREDGNG